MRYIIGIFFLACLLPVSFVLAQTDEFNIRVFAGDDIIAPSTPTLISATPIAPTQIDLAWSSSTDNWIFGGYVLWRDGSPIATTTQTTYSDTGLSPETGYLYAVYAFDAAGNFSSSSNQLTATTTPLPPVATSTPTTTSTGQGEATQTIVLRNFSLIPSDTNALLRWSTNIPSRFTLRWGRTDAYLGGYITNDTYAKEQVTELEGLEPGSVYLYELVGYSPAGRAVTLKRGQFTTVTDRENRVVANVERLTASVVGEDVSLRYEFPPNEVGARVRIVRSHLGFPIDPYDGAVVYDGTSETFVDEGALRVHGTQYYTVFVIGADGTVSSGAVVIANRFSQTNNPGSGGVGSTTSPTVPEPVLPEILLPLLNHNDIVITQGNLLYTFLSDKVELSSHQPFTISIAKVALPPHLKSIVVTLLDPTDQRRSYSFLLRINKTGTAYEATIAPLQVLGVSRLEVEVYDFEALIVGRYRIQMNFVPEPIEEKSVIFPDAFIEPLSYMSILGVSLGLIILLLWLFIAWRRRRTEDKA
jgi:hypothetical protein